MIVIISYNESTTIITLQLVIKLIQKESKINFSQISVPR